MNMFYIFRWHFFIYKDVPYFDTKYNSVISR